MRYVTFSLRPWASYEDGLKDNGKVKASTNHDPFLLKITLGLAGTRADATATSYTPLLTRYCTLSSLYLLCTSAVSNKPWLVTSIVLWLSTVLCPVFVANPRPERDGYIRSPVERLDAPAQLSRVYPTSCTCDNIPGFPPRIVESLGTRLSLPMLT